MKWARRHHLLAIPLIVGAIVSGPLIAEACTLMKSKDAKSAKLVVYFTKFAKEDQTGGKYKACRIVTSPDKATQTFHITPFRQDATVVVLRTNWPKK